MSGQVLAWLGEQVRVQSLKTRHSEEVVGITMFLEIR